MRLPAWVWCAIAGGVTFALIVVAVLTIAAHALDRTLVRALG
ncbi:hypothetical protein Val02_78770 [Virgisporangium aliadipatigenens]|uniref:Uncharacterized protein n=1 Tax=Virgisporangium aliadipatigenens TaxID=741659 RepID=A0A8J3YWC6_9ACTN|nr:hypothetical protein [Virgisporangium aliadipatigenens]GIJ50991.1 hypothetical protein Val02_78770 [Virgisporangium aliadipatigenens]